MARNTGKHLVLRWNTYSVEMVVPADVRPMLKLSKFSKSLETENLVEAEIRKLPHIHRWKSLIKAARAKERGEIVDLEATVEESRKLFEELGGGESAFETVAHTLRPGEKLDEKTKDKVRAYGMATKAYTPTTKYVEEWVTQHGYVPEVKDGAVTFLLGNFCKRFPFFETIEKSELKIWVDDMLQGRKGYPEWTRRTVNKNFGYVNKLWAYCEGKYTEATNLAVGASILPPVNRTKAARKKSTNVTYKPYEVAECYMLLDAAVEKDDQNLIDMIKLGMYTGMRLNEIGNMKVSSVLDDRFVVEDSKTYNGEREIPIHPDIQQMVERLKQTSTDGFLISGESSNNKYKTRTKGISHRFNRLKTQLGFEIKRHAFHSFRATMANRFENAHVEQNLAARIIGHAVPDETYGGYSGKIDWEVAVATMAKLQYPRP